MEFREGVYMGPAGQLVDVYTHYEEGCWNMELAVSCSETQSFWLDTGSMAPELRYLIDGFEYLGPL